MYFKETAAKICWGRFISFISTHRYKLEKQRGTLDMPVFILWPMLGFIAVRITVLEFCNCLPNVACSQVDVHFELIPHKAFRCYCNVVLACGPVLDFSSCF